MTNKGPDFVVHRHSSLMMCETEAILEELLLELDLAHVPYQRLGKRALVTPAHQLHHLQNALKERGIHPRIIGQPILRDEPEQEDTP